MKLDKLIPLGRDRQIADDLDGWFVSEKMDGCRAFWDGQNFWTRGGFIVKAPARIIAKLPAGRRLDGEIWAGRQGFTEARVAVQYDRWTPACRFTVFDAPDARGTWAQRMAEAARLYADCVNFTECQDWQHANDLLFDVQSACGEGLVFRHPTAIGYEHGRTENFIKLKEPIL